MRRFGLILVAFTIFGLGTESSGQTNSKLKIVFLRQIDGPNGPEVNAWVSDLDGQNQVKITHSGWVSCAKWANERTLAVVSNYNIWLITIEQGIKTHVKKLTDFGDVRIVSCAPDGWIYFDRFYTDDRGEGYLCRIRIDGTGYQVLKHHALWLSGSEVTPFRPYHIAATKDKVFYVFWGQDNLIQIREINPSRKTERTIFTLSDLTRIIPSIVCTRDGEKVFFTPLNRLWEINTVSLALTIYDSIKFDIYALMPGGKQALLDSGESIYLCDLDPPARPQLLIKNASCPDIWGGLK